MNQIWLDNLKTLKEWTAFGFCEAHMEKLPWPIPYGRALRRLYENMEIRVLDKKLLTPCEPMPNSQTMASNGRWAATSQIFNLNHSCGLYGEGVIADKRKAEHPELAPFIDEVMAFLRENTKHFGGYTHSNPDIRRVVNEGFLSMVEEFDKELEAVKAEGEKAKPEELNFLLALKEYTEGVKAFHARTLVALKEAAAKAKGERKRKLETVASAFSNCFLWKSEGFLEGLLAVNMTWMLDGCDSIGLFDQTLSPLYEKDLASGKVDVAFVRELLDELWNTFEEFNGWNLQIGGRRPDGSDGCGPFTSECIQASARNKFRRPNVAFRITSDTPDSYVAEVLKALAAGSGRPALYNDDLYIKTLLSLDLGLNERDVREIGFGGCTETMIAGMSNVGSLEGDINLAKALELALNDGKDPVSKNQDGPRTGAFESFKSFDAFMAAFKRQIQYRTDAFVSANREALKSRFTKGDPKIYRSFFTRDCVKNRKSFEAGGARYNWAVVCYQGIAIAIDSVAAIKKAVFEDKSVGAKELLEALADDFDGKEGVRAKLLAAPKYGNDDPYVDSLGRELTDYAWKELYSHSTPRGGRYLGSCILFTTYLGAGRYVGATPDGRKAFTALNDSIGAAAGRDKLGPTALFKSVTSLPLKYAVGTPVLNVRFRKDLFKSAEGLDKMVKLVRAYFKQGGLQLQVSVLDAKEMRAAQAEPEKHANLVVRIGGYSEYFNRLGKDLQDTVIQRTEHGV